MKRPKAKSRTKTISVTDKRMRMNKATMAKRKMTNNRVLTMSWIKWTYRVLSRKNSRVINTTKRTNNSCSREINRLENRKRRTKMKMKNRMIKSLNNKRNPLPHLQRATRGHNRLSSPRNSLQHQDRTPRKKSNLTLSSDNSVDFLLLFYYSPLLSLLITYKSDKLYLSKDPTICLYIDSAPRLNFPSKIHGDVI